MPFNLVDPDTGEVHYGITPRTSEEILALLNRRVIENISNNLGQPTIIDTSESSVVGRLNKIFADRLANLWLETEMIEGSFYVNDAFGTSLNKLAMLVGLFRDAAQYTTGELRVFGEDKTIVPSQTSYASLRGDVFINLLDFEITLTKCLSFKTFVGVNKVDREYSIVIDTNTYSIISTTDSHYDILTQLKTALDASDAVTATVSADLGKDSYLYVEKIQQEETILPMYVEVSSLLTPKSVEVEQQVRAKDRGAIFGDADTVIEILNTVSGLDSVYNPSDFILGGARETDEALRERILNDYQSVGSGTPDSVVTRLREIPAVRSVYIDNNRTFATNANGVPPKAYEIIISHVESDEAIAKVIWDSKPAGIATHGAISVIVQDANGVDQTVKFTNAEEMFMHFKVSYKTTNDSGEVYPVDGDLTIKEAITEEGDSYTINQDVIGKRFYAPIFENVEGISELTVQVCALSSPTTNPDDPLLVWSDKTPISRTQIATFATNRVFVYNIT